MVDDLKNEYSGNTKGSSQAISSWAKLRKAKRKKASKSYEAKGKKALKEFNYQERKEQIERVSSGFKSAGRTAKSTGKVVAGATKGIKRRFVSLSGRRI